MTISEDMKTELKKQISDWVQMNDETKKIRETLKEVNGKKKTCEENILLMMKTFNINEFSLSSGGSIRRKVTHTKTAINKKDMLACISNIVKNEDTINEIFGKINESQKTVEKHKLMQSHK